MSGISFIFMLISLAALITADLMKLALATTIIKCLTSILFIVTAVNSYKSLKQNKNYFIFMLFGFLFSFGGDLFLALGSEGTFFMIGVISFSIGHVMFTAGYSYLTKFSKWDIFFFLIIFVPTTTLMLNGDFEYGDMKALVVVYAAIISLMVSKAISMRMFYNDNKDAVNLSIVGSVLFFISDYILLFLFFYPGASPLLQEVNWFLYYLGQGVLALSFGQKLEIKKE